LYTLPFNTAFQALATRTTEDAKKAFEDTFRSQVGRASCGNSVSVPSKYNNFVAEASKFGEWYVGVTHDASKSVEHTIKEKGRLSRTPFRHSIARAGVLPRLLFFISWDIAWSQSSVSRGAMLRPKQTALEVSSRPALFFIRQMYVFVPLFCRSVIAPHVDYLEFRNKLRFDFS
jgi:intein/homing endonuclease